MNKDHLEKRYIYNRRLNNTEALIMHAITYGEPCEAMIDYLQELKSRLKDNEDDK